MPVLLILASLLSQVPTSKADSPTAPRLCREHRAGPQEIIAPAAITTKIAKGNSPSRATLRFSSVGPPTDRRYCPATPRAAA